MITPTEEKLPPARLPSARSRELGAELRQVRMNAGFKATLVCDELEWSGAKLSKLESGIRGGSDADTATLFGFYRADKATRARILTLAAEPDYGYFLRMHGENSSGSLLCTRLHEVMAQKIHCYVPLFVPPLLQSMGYAKALLKQSEVSQDQRATWLSARVARQAVLLQKMPPEVTVYIHEAALNMVVGNAQVMHDNMSKHSQEVVPDCLTEPVPCLGKHHGHEEEAVTVSMLIDRAVKAREALRLNWPDTDVDELSYERKFSDREYPTAILPVVRERAEPWYR